MRENKTPFVLQNPFASLGNLKQCWEICSGLSSRVIIWERRCGKACTGLAEVGGHPADIANQTAEPTPLHSTLPTVMWGFLSSASHCENAFVEFKCVFPEILNIHPFVYIMGWIPAHTSLSDSIRRHDVGTPTAVEPVRGVGATDRRPAWCLTLQLLQSGIYGIILPGKGPNRAEIGHEFSWRGCPS